MPTVLPKLYYRDAGGSIGLIVLHLKVQSADAGNRVLGRSFADPAIAAIPLERSVVVINEARVRVTSEPSGFGWRSPESTERPADYRRGA